MKTMNEKTKCMLTMGLLAVFMVMFAGEASAKPDWTSVKYTKWYVKKNPNKTIDDKDYLEVIMWFDISNNSKDGHIITAIFDKSISYDILVKVYVNFNGWNTYDFTRKNSFKISTPQKVELYPGQSTPFSVSISAENLVLNRHFFGFSWKMFNQGLLGMNSNTAPKLQINSWDIDFQVSSKK
jgi:hypothetical protein